MTKEIINYIFENKSKIKDKKIVFHFTNNESVMCNAEQFKNVFNNSIELRKDNKLEYLDLSSIIYVEVIEF